MVVRIVVIIALVLALIYICLCKYKLDYYYVMWVDECQMKRCLAAQNDSLVKNNAELKERMQVISELYNSLLIKGEQFNGISYDELEKYISNIKHDLLKKGEDVTALKMLGDSILIKPFEEM